MNFKTRSKTIHYELVTQLNPAIPRHILQEK